MDYPAKFPPEAQDRVEAAKILAGRRFERDKRAARWTSDIRRLLVRYILRIFRMFVREARRLRLWRAAEMDYQCRKFLRLLTIDAYSEKGYDNQGCRFPDMISHVDGSILPEVQQAFSRSAAWRYFEQARLALSVSRPPRRVESQPAREPEQPREEPAHGSPAAASAPVREVIQVNNTAAVIMFSEPTKRRKKRNRKPSRPRVQEPAPEPTRQPTNPVNDVAAQSQPRHPRGVKGKLRRMPKYRSRLKRAIRDAWAKRGPSASYVDISRDVDEQDPGIGENEYPWPAPGGQRGLEARLNGPDGRKVTTYLGKIKLDMIAARQL